MVLHYLDPRAEPGQPIEAYTLSADLQAVPLVVGLLANGFPDSVAFLDQVQEALATPLAGATFRRFDKGNASIPAPDEMLDAMASQCTVAVTAYGH